MKAGRGVSVHTSSVSPLVVTDAKVTGEEGEAQEGEAVPGLEDVDTDDEDVPEEFEGEVAERVGLEKEGKFVSTALFDENFDGFQTCIVVKVL